MSKMRSGIGPSKAATHIQPMRERPLRIAKACAPIHRKEGHAERDEGEDLLHLRLNDRPSDRWP